jgi:polysaccharide pyruvyl transferase WcaK-like protein
VSKDEFKTELKRMTSRSDAHYQNYVEMLGRVNRLTAALKRIRDLPWGESGDIAAAQEIAREALE